MDRRCAPGPARTRRLAPRRTAAEMTSPQYGGGSCRAAQSCSTRAITPRSTASDRPAHTSSLRLCWLLYTRPPRLRTARWRHACCAKDTAVLSRRGPSWPYEHSTKLANSRHAAWKRAAAPVLPGPRKAPQYKAGRAGVHKVPHDKRLLTNGIDGAVTCGARLHDEGCERDLLQAAAVAQQLHVHRAEHLPYRRVHVAHNHRAAPPVLVCRCRRRRCACTSHAP